MRLAISNIAWKPHERIAVYEFLCDEGVTGLEIAPAQVFPDDPDALEPGAAAAAAFLEEIGRYGLQLVSMQSLLWGVKDARLFGAAAERARFEAALARAVAFAGRFRIPNLVLGSPANRAIPDGMDRAEAEEIAQAVFCRAGDLCLAAKTKLALEPNAAAYGTNFLTTMGETIAFAARAAHPAVTVNFDIGALHMNGEFAEGAAWFAKAAPHVSHVHVSEPQLAPAPQDAAAFGSLARAILGQGYGGWFSIEMRAAGGDNLANVKAALLACKSAGARD